MTTGSVTYDHRSPWTWGGFTANLGPFGTRTWTGGDAITHATPRSRYPTVRGPKGFVSRKSVKTRGRLDLPPQPYSVTYERQFYDAMVARYEGNHYDSVFAPQPVIADDLWVKYDFRQEYKLLGKLRNRMYGSGFNPAVFLAEAPQAFRMIGDAAVRLGGAIAAIRARDPVLALKALKLTGGTARDRKLAKSIKDRTKPIGDVWIEANYGWMPLFSDAEDGAQWLAEVVTGKSPGKLSVSRSWEASAVSQQAIPKASARFTTAVHQWQLRFIIYGAKVSNTFVPGWQTLATVAWEKTPWSFAVDWFVPIGSYLESLRTASDISGTVVRSYKRTSTFGTFAANGVEFKSPWFLRKGMQYTQVYFSRTVNTEISVPHPLASLLEEKTYSYSSWRHAANAVALLSQRNWPALLEKIRKM